MIDYADFEKVFGHLNPFPYDQNYIKEAQSNRRDFEGALFIDRVLTAIGLSKAPKSYPPKSENILRQLHQTITTSSSIAVHHQLSVLFYLLLDLDRLDADGNNSRAARFAARSGLPFAYESMMRGLWLLDHHDFLGALEYLTHPDLTPEFADDIVSVLVRHARSSGGSDYTLPLAYYHTVQPVLKTAEAEGLLFDAIARSSVAEAFLFTRARPDAERQQLFSRLVVAVLDDMRGEANASRAYDLASLPLEPVEEQWLRETLTFGEGKKFKIAKDMLMMRKIAINEAGAGSEKGMWGVVMEAFKVGNGGRI